MICFSALVDKQQWLDLKLYMERRIKSDNSFPPLKNFDQARRPRSSVILMTEIQKVFKSVISNLKYSRPSEMNGQHCFWLHWFLLGNEVRFLSIARNCNLFISLAMKMVFFHCNNRSIQRSVTRPQDRIQVDVRKIYPSEVD